MLMGFGWENWGGGKHGSNTIRLDSIAAYWGLSMQPHICSARQRQGSSCCSPTASARLRRNSANLSIQSWYGREAIARQAPLKGTCQTETNSSLTPTQPMLTHGYKLSNSHSISGQAAGCTSGNFRTHRPVASARRHSKPWPFTWHSRPLTERSRKCSALPPPCKGPKKKSRAARGLC